MPINMPNIIIHNIGRIIISHKFMAIISWFHQHDHRHYNLPSSWASTITSKIRVPMQSSCPTTANTFTIVIVNITNDT